MGFFSWKCAKSKESIASCYSGKPAEQSECFLITPEKTYYEPSYEGYGDFGGRDIYEILGDGDRIRGIDLYLDGKASFDIKIVLAKKYNNEKYEDLPASEDCEYQGFFYPEDGEDDW